MQIATKPSKGINVLKVTSVRAVVPDRTSVYLDVGVSLRARCLIISDYGSFAVLYHIIFIQ